MHKLTPITIETNFPKFNQNNNETFYNKRMEESKKNELKPNLKMLKGYKIVVKPKEIEKIFNKKPDLTKKLPSNNLKNVNSKI